LPPTKIALQSQRGKAIAYALSCKFPLQLLLFFMSHHHLLLQLPYSSWNSCKKLPKVTLRSFADIINSLTTTLSRNSLGPCVYQNKNSYWWDLGKKKVV